MLKYFLLSVLLCSGCSSVYYYPNSEVPITPQDFGYSYYDLALESGGTAWIVGPGSSPRGVVIFLHGNAGNIASHFPGYAWLVDEGYEVLALDYRGFGSSSGSPSTANALEDLQELTSWMNTNRRGPYFLYGHSIGGSLATYYVATRSNQFSGVVVESAFSDYRKIAREKLDDFLLTYPFAWVLSWVVENQYSPIEVVHQVAPLPLLLIHAEDDLIVSSTHSQELFDAANEPKRLTLLERGGHAAGLSKKEVVKFFMDLSKTAP